MPRWPILVVVLAVLLAGCFGGTTSDGNNVATPTVTPSPPSQAGPAPFVGGDCAYQEALLSISKQDAQALLPAGYTPMNGLIGGQNTAILFLAALDCTTQVVHVGLTIEPPPNQPHFAGLDAYALGTYVDGPLENVTIGPRENTGIDIQILDAVRGTFGIHETLSVELTSAGPAPAPLSGPFAIRLHHESTNDTTIVNIDDLQRGVGVVQLTGNEVFGNRIPVHVPAGSTGMAIGYSVQRVVAAV